jgi:hypothetical protein
LAETPSLFKGTMAVELFHFMAGARIGQGVDREVYVFEPNPEWVIKFQLGSHDFQNVREWDLWTYAPPAARKWLAPCIDISHSGKILLQVRCNRLEHPPKRIPKWMDDMHSENWGLIKGRPVAVDYGRHLITEKGFNMRMVPRRPARWETKK